MSQQTSPILGAAHHGGKNHLSRCLYPALTNISVPFPPLSFRRPHDLSTVLSVSPAPTAVRYTLQYGVHNGRCFVGPLLTTPELVVAPQLGVVALQVGPNSQTLHTHAPVLRKLEPRGTQPGAPTTAGACCCCVLPFLDTAHAVICG